MAETADQIRAGIEQKRADLDRKLDLMELRAREELSLRNQVARRPWQAVGAAVGTGLLLGLLLGGKDKEKDKEQVQIHPYNRRSRGRRAEDLWRDIE